MGKKDGTERKRELCVCVRVSTKEACIIVHEHVVNVCLNILQIIFYYPLNSVLLQT